MKIFKSIFLVLGVVFSLGSLVAFADKDNFVYDVFEYITVDGNKLELEENPFSLDGYRMLPIRNICESMGYSVLWDESNRQVKIKKNEDELILAIDSDVILVNNEAKRVKFSPQIVKGRTYVIPAVIQIGLGDEVKVTEKGDFEITTRSGINKAYGGIKNIRTTLYRENNNGVVVGMAQINIPHLDNQNGENGIDKINEYFTRYLDNYWGGNGGFYDILVGELRELEADEFVDTEYIDNKVVFNGEGIVSIESPTFHGGSSRVQLVRGLMFNKKTGEIIRNNEIFKEDTDIHEAVVSANNNGDKELIKVIEEIKREIKWEKDIYKDDWTNDNIWNYWGVKNEEDESGMLSYISNRIESVVYDNGGCCWISIEDNGLVLNFRYYAPLTYRYASICLANVLEYMNPNFVNNLLGKDNDPVCFVLFRAVEEGNLKKVKELIENGADVNCIECDPSVGRHSETTLLDKACGKGNLEIAKLLIENGADVNFVNFDESTAFNSACRSGNLELVKLLIDNGADVNHIDISGRTELEIACEEGNLKLVRLLMGNGADVNDFSTLSALGQETYIIVCEALQGI